MTNTPALDEHTRTHNTLFETVYFKEELCLKRKLIMKIASDFLIYSKSNM